MELKKKKKKKAASILSLGKRVVVNEIRQKSLGVASKISLEGNDSSDVTYLSSLSCLKCGCEDQTCGSHLLQMEAKH